MSARSIGPATGFAVVVLAALALGACNPRPYQVRPAKAIARAVGPDGVQLVGICYGNVVNTPEQVMKEARFACGGDVTELRGTDIVWTPCGLLQPTRATFACAAAP
ncbi:MAG: hypothetical protein ACE5DS_05365 [Kiloniellaceae bacterium]